MALIFYPKSHDKSQAKPAHLFFTVVVERLDYLNGVMAHVRVPQNKKEVTRVKSISFCGRGLGEGPMPLAVIKENYLLSSNC